MVKNAGGGKAAKGQARKRSGPVAATIKQTLRKSEDPLEVYAQVSRILGGGMCHVITPDNRTLLCHIRGKFRGRGKRDNFVGPGTWLLVGLRDWEATPAPGKLSNCDVIEVYNESDKELLKQTVTTVNWSLFVSNDSKTHTVVGGVSHEDDGVDFETEQMRETRELAELQASQATTIRLDDSFTSGDGNLISVDDI